MASERINVGDNAVLTGTFRRTDTKALIDPTAATVTLQPPVGAPIALTAVKVSLGIWQATYLVDQAGLWHWSMKATGTAIAVEASAFPVYPA